MSDNRLVSIALVCASILVLTGSQLLIKSRLNAHGIVPLSPIALAGYVFGLLKDAKAWLGGFGLVVAAVFWYSAISRVPLSVGYAVGALSYPIVFLGAIAILREQFSWAGFIGNVLIVLGVMIAVSSGGPGASSSRNGIPHPGVQAWPEKKKALVRPEQKIRAS